MALDLSPEKRAILASPASGVVVAGAGSGKTTLLAEAVREDVDVRGAGLGRVLVVAFNNAAAAHLVARIGARLLEERPPQRPAADLSTAWVGTFHSLCSRIVRERPFAAGVAPDFIVADEVESRILEEQALDDALEGCGHPRVTDMLTVIGVERARTAARALLARRRSAGEARPGLVPPVEVRLDLAPLEAATAALLRSPAVSDERKDCARRALAAARAGRWGAVERINLQVGAAAKALCAPWNDERDAVVRALQEREALPYLDAFAAFFAHFADAYERQKRERGALDFEDLQLRARDLLRGDGELRQSYGFERVYVDEAQDVNPLQDELVVLLAQGAGRRLRVGDVAQAIYRFRWADVGCFLAAAEREQRFPLRENYRSQPPLLEAVNGWFEQIFAGGPVPFEPLVARAAPRPPLPQPVELVVVEADEGSPGREAEAAEVARIVARVHAEQGVALGDIAVLFRARTAVEIYERALRQAGLETVLIGGSELAEQQQVQDVLALLRLLENPQDEPALLRALASPYASASDEDLVALRAAAGEGGALFDAVSAVPALQPFGEALAGLRELRQELDLAAIVGAAMTLRGFDLAALGMDGGGLRYANLRRLLHMAGSFGRVRGADVRGFVRFVEGAADLGADPGEATVVDEDLDAVRLLTIHGAKGQEFRAVIVADCSNPGRPGQPAVLAAADGRVGLSASLDGRDEYSRLFAYDELCDEESARDGEEERRVYYVALTRAMEHLSVVGRARRTQAGRTFSGGMKFLTGALPGLPAPGGCCEVALGAGRLLVRSVRAPAEAETAATLPPEPPPLEAAAELPPEPWRPPAVAALRWSRWSYSSIEALNEPAAEAEPPAPGAGAGSRGFGERFHDAIRRVDWRAPALALDRFEARERERAGGLFAAISSGGLGSRLAAAAELRAERGFLYRLDDLILEGAIDLWAREADGGILVVDWKTGLRGLDEPQPFALQQAVYALAALRAGAAAVETAWCLLERDGLLVGERFGPADAERLAARIRAALAGAAPA